MNVQEHDHNCVLIVEDDPDIREITKLYLRMVGRSALTAENGQEAIELLEKGENPCLILLDLMMPVMDGWTFAEVLSHNEKFSHIPIIVATAFADDADTVTNARRILKKPISISQLKHLLETYCQ